PGPGPAAPVSPAGLTPEAPSLAGDDQAVMPRLGGLSLRQAMEALAPFGVRLEIRGRGVVTGQSPAPGAPLSAGAMARVHLASPVGRATAVAASLQP
ncbi:MAG: PASTA domain-containing protein, partial [Candidatus Rokuibacteriota bacterium]